MQEERNKKNIYPLITTEKNLNKRKINKIKRWWIALVDIKQQKSLLRRNFDSEAQTKLPLVFMTEFGRFQMEKGKQTRT